MFKIHKIIVPTDLSKVSLSAFDYAKSIALQWNAEIHLLYVLDSHPAVLSLQSDDEDISKVLEKAKSKVSDKMEDIKTELTNNSSLKIETVIKEGIDYEEIVNYSKEISSELIVIATHGRTGILRNLLGSVAEKVIRYAKCPVLVTTPTEEDL